MSENSTRAKLDRLFPPPSPSRVPAPPAPPAQIVPSKDSLHRLEQEVLGDDALAEGELSVKERLERLVAITKARPRKAEPHETGKSLPGLALSKAVDGEEVENDFGSFYRVDEVFPLSHCQGRMPLERLRNVPREAFSLLSRGDDSFEIDLERALFLDTETTGLAGGSGTCAFLVGLGFVEDESFVVRQLFMRDYDEEAAMLHALGELLSRFDVLLSYNGKSFDIPLLESRFVLSRQRLSFERMLHFDLLHPARNLWKARIESCRLMELESRLLGLEREDDVPGHMIPQLYFRFVRTGDASGMRNVFHHNRHDILSLAALTVCASDLLDENHVPDDPLDDVSLGRLFERADQPERSMLHYSRAVEAGVTGVARRRALKALADQHKRRGELDDACSIWRKLMDENTMESIYALHELAMVSEHRDGDFADGVELCDRALARLDESYDLPLAFRVKWREAFAHRRQRLDRRMSTPGRLEPSP